MRGGQNGLDVRARSAFIVVLGVSLAGCSWLGSTSHDPNPQVYGLHDRVPEGGGRFKIGDPYTVDGQRFYPHEDTSYDKTGMASWYGEYFHGRKTANGEWYDMNRLSAAHPTLPLPVYARVTNTQNGRSLVVRVNDRGPFRRNRIIDLSKAAAGKLGMVKQGTAPVRVTYIARAPLEGDVPNMQTLDRGSSWLTPIWTSSVDQRTPQRASKRRGAWTAPNGGSADAPVITGSISRPQPRLPLDDVPQPVSGAGFYVEAASFTDEAGARSLADQLVHVGEFEVLPQENDGRTEYLVRLGPFASASEAAYSVDALAAVGLGGALITGR